MLAIEEYQDRAARTLEALEPIVQVLYTAASAGDRVAALHAYATVRALVDDLRQLSAADNESAGRITHPTAIVNENVLRLLSACRALAGLDASGHPLSQQHLWALGAIQSLRGPHAFDTR